MTKFNIDNCPRFFTTFEYEGREIPFEVIGPTEDEMGPLLEAFADFIRKHRHLGSSNVSAPTSDLIQKLDGQLAGGSAESRNVRCQSSRQSNAHRR